MSLQVHAPLVLAAVTMPVGSAVIAGVYLVQYRVGARWRPPLVGAHFLAVTAIICTYSVLCVDRYRDTVWRYPGAAVFAAGSAVFWYAVRCHPTCLVPDTSGGVVRAGPYTYIRHPIYSGGLLAALGLIGVAPSLDLVVVWVVLAVSLWILAAIEERELRIRFSSAYERYAEQTHLLIPGLL